MSTKKEELDLSVPSQNYSSEESRRRKSLLHCLIRIVVKHISKLSSQHGHVIGLLWSLECISESKYNDAIRNNFKTFVSLVQKLKVHFTVPNQQIMSHISLNLNPNLVVAAFINFHLQMVEVILYFEAGSIARVKGSIQNLQTELGFLMTFLGDTAMHLQPTKNIVTDIEAMVYEVGSFFYLFFVTLFLFDITMEIGTSTAITDIEAVVNEVGSLLHKRFFDLIEDITLQTTKEEESNENGKKLEVTNKAMMGIKALVREVGTFLEPSVFRGNDQVLESGKLDLALSNLLTKFELLKTKIKEHCIAFSKMPSDMTPKNAVVSLLTVDSVLDDLMCTLNNYSEKIIGVEDQIVTLHKELMSLRSSVTDIAVQREAEHEELMIQTKDIAYEVEYVINSFPHVWYLTLRLPQLIEKIQLIKMAIKQMKNNVDTAGIPEVVKYPSEHVSSQSTKYPVFGNTVVGFEKVATEIVKQLVRGPGQLQIISIVGMPGLGKTTLANILYNDPRVVDHFDNRSWCVVSQTYNKKKLLIEMLSSMSRSKSETFMNMKEESLTEKLYKSLIKLRYLIVIDDIWDINVWNDLERYFPKDKIGSRILFTTRNKEVGLKASSDNVIIELPLLSDAESWELLQGKVFEDEKCPQELLDIGKQIATNCHGLPLAVVIIAAVLANMEKKEHLWQEIERNLSSHLLDNPNKVMQILELSYEHLPNHLKPCFLYIGEYAEDAEIVVGELIRLWVAEGFIKKEEQKCLEDVALKYLMELIDRSLVLVSRRRYNGEVKTCKVHDLLHEMCLRIGEKKNFLKIVKYEVTSNEDDLPMLFSQVPMYWQHHCVGIDCWDRSFSLSPGLHVRSLTCVCDYPDLSTIITSSFKVLRVFALTRSKRVDYDGLIGIEHMVNLRLLEIPFKLPPMESFRKLEYLSVDNSNTVEIPDVLLTMMSLRCMFFRGGAYFSASCCWQAAMEQSFQISNNIQSISLLQIFFASVVKILRCCPNLHRLKCISCRLDNCPWDSLSQLISLKINMALTSSIPIGLPLNLKELILIGVTMSLEQTEIIGRLLNLEALKLEKVAFGGPTWNASTEFPRLKFLKLSRVDLEEWNASNDNFPSLEGLALKYCKRLKMIPSTLGDILTLQKIEVYRCAESVNESAKQIQEDQQEMGNEVLKVIISH